MKQVVQSELSLEHINPELIDVLCEVEYEVYNGSGDIDDPSEVDILNITVLEDVRDSLTREKIVSKGQILKVDSTLTHDIERMIEKGAL